MSEGKGEIYIVVNFDMIVKHIKPIGKNENIFLECDQYVTYLGSTVDGTVITLTQFYEYQFVMVDAPGNCSEAKLFNKFIDEDLIITRSEFDPLIIKCIAKNVNRRGKDVSLQVEFLDPNGKLCVAHWDPKILVDTEPGLATEKPVKTNILDENQTKLTH